MDAIIVLAFALVFIPLCFGVSLWITLRTLKKSAEPVSSGMSGTVNVPVRQLTHGDWISSSRNSLNPRLEIAPDGLHFRVSSVTHWRFEDIVRVDTPWVPFKTCVAFRAQENLLSDNVANRERARDLLRALPAALAFTPRAAALRASPAATGR